MRDRKNTKPRMRGTCLIGVLSLVGLATLAACGGEPGEEGVSMEMTPEEMARMQSGGQGAVDSTGAAVRQPVHLTEAQERTLGVVYLTVESRALERTIRTVGRVVAAEDLVADVTLKIDGFVEELYVSTTGEAVWKGQPLLTLYSPELVAAQEELLTAKRLASRVDETAEEAWRSSQAMLESARRRLSYWDITDEQIDLLERTGEVTKTLTLTSPVNGIVLDRIVLQGQRVTPGLLLYRIADLTRIWVEGDVFEQDLQFVHLGSQSHIEVAAYRGEHIMSQVSFVYPTVDTLSRTNRVRVTLENPDLRLKPGMFATMFFDTHLPEAVAIPLQALLLTGTRNLVFVRSADGTLHPREVVLGGQAGDHIQILAGLEVGETIVGSANFLVDSESRLASTDGGMPGMQHGSGIEETDDMSDMDDMGDMDDTTSQTPEREHD